MKTSTMTTPPERTASVAIAEGRLTKEELCRILRASGFVGAVAFWRPLEQLAPPELAERAKGTLHVIARFTYEECEGMAYSPEQAESFEYCGLNPRGVRRPVKEM
jgi:hypothetical protein